MHDTIRLGLIGAGPWGKNYIRTIADLPEISLAAVATSNPATANLVPQQCTIHAQWQRLINRKDLDGLIIATPPDLHAPMALAAINAGLNVLVEKPLTTNKDSARAIRDAAQAAKTVVYTGHIHLFSPAYRILKERIKEDGGALNVKGMGGNWGPFRPGVTPLWDWGAHDLAMIFDLLGHPPTQWNAKFIDNLQTKEGLGQTIAVTFSFPTDARAICTFGNTISPKVRQLQVRTHQAEYLLDDLAASKLTRKERNADHPTPIDHPQESPLTQMVRDFCQAIRSGKGDTHHLDLGVRVVEQLEAIDQALDHSLHR